MSHARHRQRAWPLITRIRRESLNFTGYLVNRPAQGILRLIDTVSLYRRPPKPHQNRTTCLIELPMKQATSSRRTMCGRITQYRHAVEYLDALRIDLPLQAGINPEPIGRYNVPPQSKVQLLHQDEDGLRMEPVKWGYAPFWAQGKRPPAINARVETAATSKFFRDVWKTGRAIVPADGWYEWKKDEANPKIKQPYLIKLKTGEPCFFAAIGQFQRGGTAEPRDGDGFVIITASSGAGMLDIHDRRPLVLSPECAAHWLDPELSPDEAEDIALEHGLAVDEFDWYPVPAAVGNVRNDGAHLIERISDPAR